MTLSKCSAEEEFWSESYLMMEVKKHLRPSGHYDDRTVMKVVEKRIQAVRHQRADLRAAEYKSHYPTSLADPSKERENNQFCKLGQLAPLHRCKESRGCFF